MKGRILVIDGANRPLKAALLVDGRVEDLLMDPARPPVFPNVGEFFLSPVTRLIPKMGAAFLRLSPQHTGYLRDAKGLREGEVVTVQVTGYPEPGKAYPVTRDCIFKSRLLILTPHAPGINVSRQIKDETERTRLAEVAERAVADAASDWGRTSYEGGVIVRSAAVGAQEEALRWEARELMLELTSLQGDAETLASAVGAHPVGQSPLPFTVALREWTNPIPDKIVATDELDPEVFSTPPSEPDETRNVFGAVLPARILEYFDGPDPFDHYGVWDEIEKLKSPRVDLPSGGWMAVESTRAMVTVDVNTAGEFGGGAALTANLEAARELPRQLRLRGLGGQVAIDFAPLPKKDRKRIEEALKAAFRRDPVETTLAGWTPLGNFELQRKRERRPLAELLA